jgi:hypothetical protein
MSKVTEVKLRAGQTKIIKQYEWEELEKLYKQKYDTLINTYKPSHV